MVRGERAYMAAHEPQPTVCLPDFPQRVGSCSADERGGPEVRFQLRLLCQVRLAPRSECWLLIQRRSVS